jgi:hypothetical protein
MVLPERSAAKALEKIEVMRSTTHGQFFNSSPSSSRTLVFCCGGGVTRSFVVAKVIKMSAIERTAKIPIVS